MRKEIRNTAQDKRWPRRHRMAHHAYLAGHKPRPVPLRVSLAYETDFELAVAQRGKVACEAAGLPYNQGMV
jgi:hypothetical protein